MAAKQLKLPERFDITQVETLKSDFQAALDSKSKTIHINAAVVKNVDSAAVQLLLSFDKAMKSKDKNVEIIKMDEDFTAALTMLGAQGLLALA